MVRPADPDDRRWRALGQQLEMQQLPNVRASAAQWGTVVTGLTGLFGLAALVASPQTIGSLSPFYRYLLGLLFLVGLAFAVLAVWRAALAAEGTPDEAYLPPDQLRDFYYKASRRAADNLKDSRKLALASLGAIALAIPVSWYAPRETSPTTVLVLQHSGAVSCGQFVRDSAGHLALQSAAGAPASALADVTSLVVVPACP